MIYVAMFATPIYFLLILLLNIYCFDALCSWLFAFLFWQTCWLLSTPSVTNYTEKRWIYTY
jgi:hypothetical protein